MLTSKNCFVLAGLLLLSSLAYAEYTFALSEDLNLRLGGDIRARFEGFDRTVPFPDGRPDGKNYPPQQYLRVRTRAWMALDLADSMTLNLRLVNRIHKISSSPGDPNDAGDATWEFPDELIVDNFNLVLKNFSEGFTLTLGRQSLGFGNGLILSEGTPFDQGRTVYMDGVSLRYKDESDCVTVFMFYDEWKDRTVFLNDQNRRLRVGDTFTAGTYWTHTFSPAWNLDLYYLFNDVDDKHPLIAERYHDADCSTSLHTAGGRLFGKPLEDWEYSLEIAKQGGRNANGGRNEGLLIDARLKYYLTELLPWTPSLGCNYTHYSGDKRGSKHSEGWNSLLSQAPLWQEELIPIMLNGNWTNLNIFRGDLTLNPLENLKLVLASTAYYADEPPAVVGTHVRSGNGNYMGLLLSAYASYKLNDNFNFVFQFSRFDPGDYYANGQHSNWGRFEVTMTF
ncbi:MAG: alginate export family protein [Lentisphaerae bacterium]|nr:alginate export family protein [Lentisphaerota bacterium]